MTLRPHVPFLLSLALLTACRTDPDPGPPTGGTGTGDSSASTSGSTPSPTVDPARIEVATSGPVVCADPSARDEQPFDLLVSQQEPPKKEWFWGDGALVGDLTGDGRPDVLLPGFWETFFYVGGQATLFDDASDRLQGLPVAGSSGGSLADYDGDGDLDVLLTRYLAPDTLLRNDGTGRFTDVSAEAGLLDVRHKSMASSWGDYDGDGDLDLFVGCYGVIDESQENPDHDDFDPGDPSVLYRNEGDGTFSDQSHLLPQEAHDGLTFVGGFVDVDLDGWQDLYIVNDFGASYPNVLLRNVGGTFEHDPTAGLDIAITGMGLAIGDLNGDLLPDFAMGAWNGNHVLKSTPVGWVDYSATTGLPNDLERTQKIAWGVTFDDLDNDGDLDAPMVYGYLDASYASSPLQPDALYVQQPDGTFVDEGPAWGFHHPTVGRGFVVTDLDGNGWLDIVKRDLAGPSLTYLARCGEAAWLTVALHDTEGMNRFGVGARIEAEVAGTVQTRTVWAGTIGHASGGPPTVHFGLADHASVEVLRVHWPDGTVSEHRDLATRQHVDITRRALD